MSVFKMLIARDTIFAWSLNELLSIKTQIKGNEVIPNNHGVHFAPRKISGPYLPILSIKSSSVWQQQWSEWISSYYLLDDLSVDYFFPQYPPLLSCSNLRSFVTQRGSSLSNKTLCSAIHNHTLSLLSCLFEFEVKNIGCTLQTQMGVSLKWNYNNNLINRIWLA